MYYEFMYILMMRTDDSDRFNEIIMKLADLIFSASEHAGPWVGSDGHVYCNIGRIIIEL